MSLYERVDRDVSPRPRESFEFLLVYIVCFVGEIRSPHRQLLVQARTHAECLHRRPRVFFEEWDDPLISGIGWVSELIEIAGGIDIFADRRDQGAAKDRIVTMEEVVERQPEVIIGSWCGKKFRPEKVRARSGWYAIPAVRSGQLHEVKSPIILQPGPVAG